jgi:hypothetical protein
MQHMLQNAPFKVFFLTRAAVFVHDGISEFLADIAICILLTPPVPLLPHNV